MTDPSTATPRAFRLRLAATLLAVGLVAAVVAALPVAPTDLDRHQFPKELSLHLAVFLAALVSGRGVLATIPRGILLLGGAIVVWSVLGVAVALNPWLTLRATGLTATGFLAFATAHFLASHGQRRLLLAGVGTAAVVGVSSALAQAWGMDHTAFADLRAPGGTLGNRNFVAHLAAIALSLGVVGVIASRRRAATIASSILVAAVVVTLVLTRSRAGWLAGIGSISMVTLWLLLVPAQIRASVSRRRAMLVPALALAGVAIAVVIPNTLEWRSDSPYTDTLGNLTNYREGSGRGRLLQYQHSLTLALRHPVLGVGAGNWPLRYGEVAPRNDPSWARNDVIPLNPWPSSDWMALVSERGFAAPAVVLLIGIGLLLVAFRARGQSPEAALQGAAAAGVLTAALISGLFDAVLLLAIPVGIVSVAVGALLPTPESTAVRTVAPLARRLLLLLVLLATVRSAQQTVAYVVAGEGKTRQAMTSGVRIDPFSFPLQIGLGKSGPCRSSAPHARAALKLAPTWASAQRAAKRCGAQ